MLSKHTEQTGLPSHCRWSQALSASNGCAVASSTRPNATNWNNLFISSIDFRPMQPVQSVIWITGFV